jgi:putative membrane protein
MFWIGPGWGLVWGLIWAAFWVAIIVVAFLLLRHELPQMHHRFGEPPALRMLEERYARGEISREEFLERREVLLQPIRPPQAPPPPPAGGSAGEDTEDTSGAGPTEPIPPSSSSA